MALKNLIIHRFNYLDCNVCSFEMYSITKLLTAKILNLKECSLTHLMRIWSTSTVAYSRARAKDAC